MHDKLLGSGFALVGVYCVAKFGIQHIDVAVEPSFGNAVLNIFVNIAEAFAVFF